jgi:DNA-binding NtrC family response regulator
LSPELQDRLVRLLSERAHGARKATMPHRDHRVRIVAGSDRSLRTDLAAGAFSDVLFYRLNVIHIDELHQRESEDTAMRARDITSAIGRPDTPL